MNLFSAAEAITFPAVQLFLDRASANGARLTLTDVDAPVVAEICRRLDGIPLAIEVAAARVYAYGMRGTMGLLEKQFKFLWQGRRTASIRHQTLGAMLDWSHDLLSDMERTVFRRLAIFADAFSLEDVGAVAGDVDVSAERAVAALGSLVAKSLVTMEGSGVDVRYRLMHVTRAYAAVKLEEVSEGEQTAERYAKHMCVSKRARSAAGARQSISA